MRILFRHVHGGYADSFLRGDHEYLIPTTEPLRLSEHWPGARIVDPGALRDEPIDVAVLQSPDEIEQVHDATGRRPGRDLPAVYLEHNAPRPSAAHSRHPLADQHSIPIVHVTHFNELFWDSGRAPTTVVEHGIPDPGRLYRGDSARIGVVINEPGRRGRTTGTDLLPAFAAIAPVDVFGIAAAQASSGRGHGVHDAGDLPADRLHAELSDRRLYLHPYRWTSLGLSLLEAMMSGMPVVAVAATEAIRAIPAGAGVVSTELDELVRGARALIADPDLAHEMGERGREHALENYSLPRFLARWDEVLTHAVAMSAPRARRTEGATR